MNRIGLALSGGGFRATLFHLGMVRFLREANILPRVSHVTSVSGGSILAAHLVQNWNRYTGSLEEFDAAAAEVIRFVQMDIRNRVVRRFPLGMPVRAVNAVTLRRSLRQLTRTGLLEYHYQRYLYGDTCLFQLPERPKLFILTTNLSEGCLSAFTRDGLLILRRRPGQAPHFDRIHTGLATVPMAVTASSAFPGFFPPLELQGQDVGADPGQFNRLAFTDGGIYDNLGVRMFRCLERSWLASEIGLDASDLNDADQVCRTLASAAQADEGAALTSLARLMNLRNEGAGDAVTQQVARLWDVIRNENLARERSFEGLSLADPDALPLMDEARLRGGELDPGERLWLNRQLVDAAFRAAGQSCFRSTHSSFDAVLASDAGMQFKIVNNARAGGLVATAMRSTDIVMDRVWQLECDTFRGTPGFVFAPIAQVISPEDDATAMHPEMQRMAADIRTDLDRFTPLEISALVRHGYCVGRSVCRQRPDLFGEAIPAGAPWDPMSAEIRRGSAVPAKTVAGLPATSMDAVQTRSLQQSSARTLWSTLLDYRDWTSFVYVPLLIPILFVMPYFLWKWYRQSQVAQQLIESMAQSSRDYEVMRQLLQDGPVRPFSGMPIEEVQELAAPDYKGFEVISDTRVLDYRAWDTTKPRGDASWVFVYRRMRVQKKTADANRFLLNLRGATNKVQVRTLHPRVPAKVKVRRDVPVSGANAYEYLFEIEFDLSKIPALGVVDLPIEIVATEPEGLQQDSAVFFVDAETSLCSCWLLLPEGMPYKDYEILRYPANDSSSPEAIVPANLLGSTDGQILAFSLLKLSPGYKYEVRWSFQP